MNDERLVPIDELLCDATLWGCDERDARRLESALATDPGLRREARALAHTAAAITASLATRDEEPLPTALRRRLDQIAIGFAMDRRRLTLADVAVALETPSTRPVDDRPTVIRGPWISHLVAAAALLVAVVLFFTRERSPRIVPLDIQRMTLLRDADDLVRMDWKGDGVAGEVCWSDSRQQGFLTFRGLTRNDPSEFQYQLWIFDRGRADTAERPIDGGVFDVEDRAEIVVPIRANIRVHDAFAFAVTRERPGGVVVSAKDQIVTSAGL